MHRRLFLYPLILLLGLLGLHAQPNQPLVHASLEVEQPVRPVLIGKETAILKINLHIKRIVIQTSVQKIRLSTAGTSDLEDIRTISIWYTKDSASFYRRHRFDLARPPEERMRFYGSNYVSEGDNFFWIVCELSNQAKLDHHIKIDLHSVQLSDGQLFTDTANHPPLRIGHALLQAGQNGVHTYRIPGLVTTNEGTLIAACDNRINSSTDLQEDIDVGMKRSTDGGQTWGPMQVIMDMGEWGGKPNIENGIGDPSILIDRATNTIWVAAVWAHGHPGKRNWFASDQGMTPEETSQLMLVKSEDDGLSWSQPINITSQVKQEDWHLLLQGPGKGITLIDGTLVFPAQFKDHEEVPHSTLIYSEDHGNTWRIGTGAKSHTTESQVVELSDGSLMLNMRDDRGRTNPTGGRRSVAITHDLGHSWTEHPTSEKALVEPVCMASLIQLNYEGESLLVFSNPAVSNGPRRNITLKLSRDEGMSWPEEYDLLLNEDPCFGYSCLTRIDEETIGILYESQGGLIFQRIGIMDLLRE